MNFAVTQPATGPAAMPPLPPAAADRLAKLAAAMEKLAPTMVGYPVTQDYDYPEVAPLLRYALNNCGDPFAESLYRENTFEFEREVITFFQKHLRAPDG